MLWNNWRGIGEFLEATFVVALFSSFIKQEAKFPARYLPHVTYLSDVVQHVVASKKIVSFCALTSVVICIMITLAITMGVGIGTGYNYCFVDQKVQPENVKNEPSSLRSGRENEFPESGFDNAEESLRRMPARTTIPPERASTPDDAESYTLTIKLHDNIDFPSLISRLRVRNKNATLELIT